MASNGTWLFSSGGFEEFFGWKITRGVPYVNVGVVCAAKHPRNGKSDLRIMGFDVREVQLGDAVASVVFHITMAYTDSTLKTWSFSTGSPDSWMLVAQGLYLTSCLSSVHILKPALAEGMTLMTSTDGHLALWSRDPADTSELRWTARHQVHQNAILSTALYTLPDSSVLLITGGDDDALVFTRITSPQSASATSKTLTIPRAHAAAITGVLCRSTAGQGVQEVVTLGLDQTVEVWEVRLRNEAEVWMDWKYRGRGRGGRVLLTLGICFG
ncbi:hypothetical protein B0A48_18519 [Cryoendolithus antarcticus]|uniref:WD40 repeat-like protein n=1 Tax=Cryoendolithus antarcticus TaxID=1507870 RepID=A0A1V8S942_9PEZI|nr:hypothetical protein B0A48_18519 [Cryoendolithus antarcticus]